MCCVATTLAQIPNGNFEAWDSSLGYKIPVGWDSYNPVTSSSSVFTCSEASPSYTNDHFVALTTKNIPGFGIIPGFAVSGKLDPVTHIPVSGFPYTARPQVVAGEWQYMPYEIGDAGYIYVLLSKWNTTDSKRDTISYTPIDLHGMVMAWQRFKFPLNYRDTAMPDSAMIVLSASSPAPVPLSFLWVDNLRLGDSATIDNVTDVAHADNSFSLSPNPANGNTNIVFNNASGSELTLYICDITGKTIGTYTLNTRKGKNTFPLNISNLGAGLYFIKITGKLQSETRKLLVE